MIIVSPSPFPAFDGEYFCFYNGKEGNKTSQQMTLSGEQESASEECGFRAKKSFEIGICFLIRIWRYLFEGIRSSVDYWKLIIGY